MASIYASTPSQTNHRMVLLERSQAKFDEPEEEDFPSELPFPWGIGHCYWNYGQKIEPCVSEDRAKNDLWIF